MRERRRRRSLELRREERAVSVTVGYVLTLAIGSLLLAGLFIAGGSFVEGEREQAIHGELSVIGERVAADIMTVDRLANQSADPDTLTATRTAEFPPRVSGDEYTIEVVPASEQLLLTHSRSGVAVEVPYRTSENVSATTVAGGDLTIRWDGDGDGNETGHIEVVES